MPRTKAENAKYLRQWRRGSQKEKRFNKPLRAYMELKYRDQYNEFCHFFKELDQKHPSTKDLTKTITFKVWKRRQLNCVESEESQAENADILTAVAEEIQPPDTQPEPENADTLTVVTEEIQPPDILTVVVEEIQPPDTQPEPPVNIDIDELDNRIQRIIDDLEEDDALRRLLNEDPFVQDADEGIDLDIEMELGEIVEPFDYELEVDF